MKSPSRRIIKYGKKIRSVTTHRQEALRKAAYKSAAIRQIDLDMIPKSLIGCRNVNPIFLHYYGAFTKKADAIIRKHAGAIAQKEICIERQKWLSRGLDAGCLDAILNHFNMECVTAMNDYECAATGHYMMLYQPDGWVHAGLLVELSPRKVTGLSFRLRKKGLPTGDVYFRIVNFVTGAVIWEKLMFDAATLTTSFVEYHTAVPSVVLNQPCNKYAFVVSCATPPMGYTNHVRVQFSITKLCCSGCGVLSDDPFTTNFYQLTSLHPHIKINFASI